MQSNKIKKKNLVVFVLIIISVSFFLNNFLINIEKSVVNSATPVLEDIVDSEIVLGKKTVNDRDFEQAVVERVVDGDTIVLEDGRKLRYIGIDTPETKHPNKDIECFGIEASDKNKNLVEGKVVYLEKDISDVDRYGRLLRYVWIKEEQTNKMIMVNEKLVEEGYALSSSYPPDIYHQDVFNDAERYAMETEKGLWSVCN